MYMKQVTLFPKQPPSLLTVRNLARLFYVNVKMGLVGSRYSGSANSPPVRLIAAGQKQKLHLSKSNWPGIPILWR
jgi:hypothetical protein